MPRAERLFDAILARREQGCRAAAAFKTGLKTVETGIHIPRTLYDTILALMQ